MKYKELIHQIKGINSWSQAKAIQSVNACLIFRNWLLGAYITEYVQKGEDRAKYGEKLLSTLSDDLGPGFSEDNLERCRKLYSFYRISATPLRKLIPATLLRNFSYEGASRKPAENQTGFNLNLLQKLSWSHFIELIRIENLLRRRFYEVEAIKNNWSSRELHRQINSLLFERIGLSKAKREVLLLAKKGELVTKPEEAIRDPYVFEFLGLKQERAYTEAQIEQSLLDHLQQFLLELGKGFCFVARQKRITFNNQHYYVDLLLYHRKLKCLVAIDLKIGEFTHQDAGQMNFYLNYLRKEEMEPDENLPVGIILCTDKEDNYVEYATGNIANKLFVSRYLLQLPSKKQLASFLEKEKRQLGE
jgi:predicted nuclease of restriction endonuclease-like (RecB) superfamily